MEFIRIGEIPEKEKSSINLGSGDGKRFIGYEIGVSCYHATKVDDEYHIVLPHVTKSTIGTLYGLIEYNYSNDKSYLIEGDLVGYGTDGEPLVKNIKIIKEINLINYG